MEARVPLLGVSSLLSLHRVSEIWRLWSSLCSRCLSLRSHLAGWPLSVLLKIAYCRIYKTYIIPISTF